jgi:nitronate monooxygenase
VSTLTQTLGIQYPIVQGPFGGGLSSVRLAAAVSNAGGLGSFGAHDLSPEQIGSIISELRVATTKPFNINLWVSRHDPEVERPDVFTFEQQAEAVLSLRPAVFSFVFGIPDAAILRECRRHSITTLGAATTPDEACALEAAGVDAIVATGFEAGGHRPSFLRRAEESLEGTMSIVPRVVDAVKVPVIAAGGIADARGMHAAFQLGAQAVQIGTAFLACEESGCSTPHRAALFSPMATRTRLSRYFTGRLARFLVNELLEELEVSGKPALPFPLQADSVRPLKARAIEANDANRMPLYGGQASPLLRHRHAADLMAELLGALRTHARRG